MEGFAWGRNKNAKPEKAGMIILLPKEPLNPLRKSPLVLVERDVETRRQGDVILSPCYRVCSFILWNGIIAARVKWVTAHNASQPKVNSPENAVHSDRIKGIV